MAQNTLSRDVLFEVCDAGDLDTLRGLLQQEFYIAKAVEKGEFVEFEKRSIQGPFFTNLLPMLIRAAKAGYVNMVDYLLSFANNHRVPYNEIITRPSITAAIGSANHVATFQKFAVVKPDSVDFDLEYSGRPLAMAVTGSPDAPPCSCDRVPLLRFLLASGADVNREYNPNLYYIELATTHSSLEVMKILLEHGAVIEQSGAMHSAARIERIDAMNLLLEHGADVNERLWKVGPGYTSQSRTKKKKALGIISDDSYGAARKWTHETPLHFSVLYRQAGATAWLVAHGADATIADSKGWSAKDMAIKMGDASVLEALGLDAGTQEIGCQSLRPVGLV